MKSLEEVVTNLMIELEEKRSGVAREERNHPAALTGEGTPEIVYFRSKKRRDF